MISPVDQLIKERKGEKRVKMKIAMGLGVTEKLVEIEYNSRGK